MLVPFETLPLKQLRKIHRAALGVETKMKDRTKIGRKLALIVDGDDPRAAIKVVNMARTVILLGQYPDFDVSLDSYGAPPPTESDINADAERHNKLKTHVDEAIDRTLGDGAGSTEETPKVENVSSGTTAQRIRSAVAQLGPGKARELLADVGGSFLEEEQLRGEKKEKRKEFSDEIKENTVEIFEAAADPTNCPDPVGALAKIDVLHTKNKKLEVERKEVTDSYDADIGTARDHIRHVLDNLNQEKLPGIE